MGGDKGGSLGPKAVWNRVKAKGTIFSPLCIRYALSDTDRTSLLGLTKLRWYCQLCEKPCRDENGYKCHVSSESHLRQVAHPRPTPPTPLRFCHMSTSSCDSIAKQHTTSSVPDTAHHIRLRKAAMHGMGAILLTTAVCARTEVISERHHIHLNATKWLTLTEFVAYLGKEGLAEVDVDEEVQICCEIKCKKPQFPYSFYHEYRFVRFISECSSLGLPCYAPPTPCLVLTPRMVVPGRMAHPIHQPRPRGSQVSGRISLRACYAMSGTKLANRRKEALAKKEKMDMDDAETPHPRAVPDIAYPMHRKIWCSTGLRGRMIGRVIWGEGTDISLYLTGVRCLPEDTSLGSCYALTSTEVGVQFVLEWYAGTEVGFSCTRVVPATGRNSTEGGRCGTRGREDG
eukprot:279756-Rhodomonas_salina.1